MPFACRSSDPNPCMPFIVNFYFLICALEISVLYSLRSGIKIYNAQSSMSNFQAFHDFVQPFGQRGPFSTTPSRLWLQEQSLMVFHQSHQYFNILFSRCLSTMYFLLLPALHLRLMRKSFLFFKEASLIIVQTCTQHIPYTGINKSNLFISPWFCSLEVWDQGASMMRALFWVTDSGLYPNTTEGARDLSGASFLRH